MDGDFVHASAVTTLQVLAEGIDELGQAAGHRQPRNKQTGFVPPGLRAGIDQGQAASRRLLIVDRG